MLRLSDDLGFYVTVHRVRYSEQQGEEEQKDMRKIWKTALQVSIKLSTQKIHLNIIFPLNCQFSEPLDQRAPLFDRWPSEAQAT